MATSFLTRTALHELEYMSDRKVDETVLILVSGTGQGLSSVLAGVVADISKHFGQ
jgi:hypothetical protein